jgi:hypothetical protein
MPVGRNVLRDESWKQNVTVKFPRNLKEAPVFDAMQKSQSSLQPTDLKLIYLNL